MSSKSLQVYSIGSLSLTAQSLDEAGRAMEMIWILQEEMCVTLCLCNKIS